jgi:hypothetical protein
MAIPKKISWLINQIFQFIIKICAIYFGIIPVVILSGYVPYWWVIGENNAKSIRRNYS